MLTVPSAAYRPQGSLPGDGSAPRTEPAASTGVKTGEDSATLSAMVAPGVGAPVLGCTRALVSYGTLPRRGALADAQAALDWLGADLRDAEGRLARERLELTVGWYQLDAGSQASQSRTKAAIA